MKEKAKEIAKLLRKNGIRCGVIKGNGSTNPNNPKNYPVFFAINGEGKHNRYYKPTKLYLNYNLELASTIKEALDKGNVPYKWDGDSRSCFIFEIDRRD